MKKRYQTNDTSDDIENNVIQIEDGMMSNDNESYDFFDENDFNISSSTFYIDKSM